MAQVQLVEIYQTLLQAWGPQHWWPGDSTFEIMVGAILTQNTNWQNVEKAINNLKSANVLSPKKLYKLPPKRLAELIRPSGYYNIKAKRLRNLLKWLCEDNEGEFTRMLELPVDILREELLSINGIGRETADSIILYALDKPTFVVDSYTYRILYRHGLIDRDSDYEQIKEFCEWQLPKETSLYNEFHALIVKAGKLFCKPRPQCQDCPLVKFERTEIDEYT